MLFSERSLERQGDVHEATQTRFDGFVSGSDLEVAEAGSTVDPTLHGHGLTRWQEFCRASCLSHSLLLILLCSC